MAIIANPSSAGFRSHDGWGYDPVVGDEHPVLTNFVVYAPLAVAVALGLTMRRRRAWIALAGIAVALALWGLIGLTGGYDDDTQNTSRFLALIFGVPIYAAMWAAAVGAGYVVSRLLGKARPRVG